MVQNKRVLVIYTGGTFGMLKNEKGGEWGLLNFILNSLSMILM